MLAVAGCSGGDSDREARNVEVSTTTASSTTLGGQEPITTTTDPIAIREASTASATGLTSQADCVGSPPAPLVVLTWRRSGTGPQRVDVATTGDGFDTGSFSSSDLLGPETESLEWHDAKGEAVHYWRVLAQSDGGWVPSAVSTFAGPGCVGADYQD